MWARRASSCTPRGATGYRSPWATFMAAIAAGQKDRKKVEARLDLERLEKLKEAAGIPLVLHGGSGIQQQNVRLAMKHGISKINVGTEIRQAYEGALRKGIAFPRRRTPCIPVPAGYWKNGWGWPGIRKHWWNNNFQYIARAGRPSPGSCYTRRRKVLADQA